MEDDKLRQVIAVLIAIIVLAVAVLGIFLPPLLNPSPIKTPIVLAPTATPTDTPLPATPTATLVTARTSAASVLSPTPTTGPQLATPSGGLDTPLPTPTPSLSLTATLSPTGTPTTTPSPSATPTPTPTHTATAVSTPTATHTVTPGVAASLVDQADSPPDAGLCRGPGGYRLALLTQQPALRPPAGSLLAGADDTISAVWQLENVGACAWAEVSLVAGAGNPAPAPSVPRLVQLDGTPLGRVEPGQQFRAILRLRADQVIGRTLDWSWDIEVRTAYGAWLRQESPLRLVVDRPWQLPSPPEPPRLVRPNPAQELQTFAGEETYTGYDADIVFEWAQDGRPLAPDEYYVLAISHRAGIEYRWVGKATQYRPATSPQGTLGWLVDYADPAGRLRWRVLVVRRADPEAPPVYNPDEPVLTQSQEGTFRWIKPAPPERRERGETPSGGIE